VISRQRTLIIEMNFFSDVQSNSLWSSRRELSQHGRHCFAVGVWAHTNLHQRTTKRNIVSTLSIYRVVVSVAYYW